MNACIAVGLDATGEDRLRGGLLHAEPWLGPLELRPVSAWDEAWNAARDGACVLVFDPFPARGTAAGCGAFAAAHPQIRLVAYGRLPAEDPLSLAAVLRSGIHAFVTRDVDDTPRGFAYRLRHAGLVSPGAGRTPAR